jgi:hypothetical protein
MAYRITPSLGPGLETVILANGVWFDVPGRMTLISPRLGAKQVGSDGHNYVLVQAASDIAAAAAPGTQVTITEPAFTAASGAGGFYAPNSTLAPNGVPTGAFFWARSGTL